MNHSANPIIESNNGFFDVEALKVPVLGISGSDGAIIIDRNVVLKEVIRPLNLSDKSDIYGVSLCTRRLGSILSNRSIMFASPTEIASVGDIALYYKSEQEVYPVSVREDETGQLYGLMWNPEERIYFSSDDFKRIHKVVSIAL